MYTSLGAEWATLLNKVYLPSYPRAIFYTTGLYTFVFISHPLAGSVQLYWRWMRFNGNIFTIKNLVVTFVKIISCLLALRKFSNLLSNDF